MVLTGLLPAAFALTGGALVGSIDGAAAGGFGSAGGRRLVAAIGGVAGLFALQQVSGPAVRALADALGRRVDATVQARAMAATLAPAGIGHLEDPDVADQIAAARSVGTGNVTAKDAVVGLAAVAASGIGGLASAAVLAAYRWWLAATLLVLYAAMSRVFTRQLQRTVGSLRGHARRFRRSSYFRDLALGPAAANELRVFGLGSWVGRRFTEQWELAMEGFWHERRHRRWVPPAGAVVLLAAQGGTYALLGRSAARGEISLGAFAAFSGAATGVLAVFATGTDKLNITYGTASVPAAIELERIAADRRFELTGTRPARGMPASEIRFDRVTFRYPGRTDPVFRHLDLVVEAGRSLAVVGQNGAGKTTLVKLLARLYDPTEGRVTVDGFDLADIDPRAWQRRIAAIFQDFTHYQLPAADNVGFGAIERSGDRTALRDAAERAGADEIIDRLPAGWDTVLARGSPGAVDLSGGQWQRIALARALFAVDGGAGVLILDEPTAALDVRAEAAFFDRFLELTRGLTTIVISHRFSTVCRADRIVVIEDGVVVEDGDHETLRAAGGRYAHMFDLQAAHLASGSGSDG
ncbi:MAG: ABC transporter ATP-binding protein [Acidimicrobiia bacterium]|nr:ABC transporter ATP-binding protein [Acidimicrobiia bacterium]